MSRKDYWDGAYADYWKRRTDESNAPVSTAGSVVNKNDTLSTSDAVLARSIERIPIASADAVLDLGCGFGRSLPLLRHRTSRVYATDISAAMIDAARRRYADLDGVSYCLSEAERTPFPDATFGAVLCFGVFDALYQNEALVEIHRLLKVGGSLLLTGKNDNYHDDDEPAIVAEVAARRKGHYNYFTDVALLLAHMDAFGFALTAGEYFARRGDFTNEQSVSVPPDRFYEYRVLLKKSGPCRHEDMVPISSPFSKTFRRSGQAE